MLAKRYNNLMLVYLYALITLNFNFHNSNN